MKTVKIYQLLFMLYILTIAGCQDKKEKASDILKIQNLDSCRCEIKSIDILYYNFLFNSARARNWDDLRLDIPDFNRSNHGVLDANIINCNILEEIDEELKTIKLTKDQLGDADIRIVLTINYKNNNDTTLCIGGYFASELFTKERVKLETKNTNRLLYLIKNNIGYYKWIDNEDLKYMDELKDTSFIKEPIIISPYYKRYQEMMTNKNE